MWSPTHVDVIIQRAENLIIKGKNGWNNAFVVIELGKDTYRTSIKEKSGKSVVWHEECELKIPKAGNKACLVLTAYHRNSLGLDQFLGTVEIPLESFDKYERIVEWYKLSGKPGKEKGKDKIRGELEVEIGFTSSAHSQSLTSLQPKGRISIEKLTGSLFGLRHSDRKIGIKKFTSSLGRAVLNKKKKDLTTIELVEENVNHVNNNVIEPSKNYNNLDPGVISDEEENSSHKSSESLANLTDNPIVNGMATTPPVKPRRTHSKNPQISISHWGENNKTKSISFLNVSQESVSSGSSKGHSPKLEQLQRRLADRRLSSSCVDFSLLSTPKPEKKFSSSISLEKHHSESHKKLSKFAKKLKSFHSADKKEGKKIDGENSGKSDELSVVPKSEIKHKNKEELINMVMDLQKKVNCVSVRVKDLEDYLDDILVKVMDTVPKILEKS